MEADTQRETSGSCEEGLTLLGLPEQVLSGVVLSRLNSPGDMARARLVCRSFATLVPLSVRTLEIKESNLKSTGTLCSALEALPNLEALSISSNGWGCVRGEDVNMLAIAAAQYCPKLTSFKLSMGGLRPMWATALQLLLRNCPNLGEVTIGDTQHIYARIMDRQDLSLIQTTPPLGSPPLQGTADRDKLRQAGVLSLPSHVCMAADTDMLTFLGKSNKHRVTQLNLWAPEQGSSFTFKDHVAAAQGALDIAAQCSAAEFLRIANFALSVEGQGLSHGWNGTLLFQKLACLGELRHLRSLVLAGTEDYRRAPSVHPLPGSFQNLVQLTELTVKHVRAVGSVDVVCRLPRLRKLAISYTDTPGIPDQISLLTDLRILRFCNCSPVSFSVPESLGHLTLLQDLQLSELMLTSLPSSLAQLQRVSQLDVSGCHRLSALPDCLLQMSGLKELNIMGCDEIASNDSVRCALGQGVQVHIDPVVMGFSEDEWDDYGDYDDEDDDVYGVETYLP